MMLMQMDDCPRLSLCSSLPGLSAKTNVEIPPSESLKLQCFCYGVNGSNSSPLGDGMGTRGSS